MKIFGSVDVLKAVFEYQMDEVFNAETYLDFLEQIAKKYHRKKICYIQDNASYHKDKDVWAWFGEHRRQIEVFNLPPYSPELNAIETVWHHVRMTGTHNRYFDSRDEIVDTLHQVFGDIRKNPSQIRGYMAPFL